MRRVLKWVAAIVVVALGIGFALLYTPDTDPAAMRAKYGGAASRFVDVGGGLTVHVRDSGPRDAPVLLLLHGSNASLHTWEGWAARLGSRYRIVRFDFPGHGLTGADPRGVYTPDAFVDVTDRVARALGLTRFVVAGNSMGGGVAWRYALAHPQKVSALVLVDASGAPYRDPKDADIPIGFRIAQMPVLRDIAAVITPRSLIAQSLRQSVADSAAVTEPTIDLYWELLRYPGNRAATMARFGERYEGGTRAQMAALALPTLILWGAEDRLIPPDNARWFASAIPGSRMIVYPAIGHLPMEEAAMRSADDVARFLEKAAVR